MAGFEGRGIHRIGGCGRSDRVLRRTRNPVAKGLRTRIPTIEDDVWIDPPIDEMFEYLASPENHVDVVPSLVDGTEEEALPVGGTEGELTSASPGVRLDGQFRDVEFEPPTVECIDSRGTSMGR